MNTFKFFELSENGFTTDGMYAQSVCMASVKFEEISEYIVNELKMDLVDIPVDPADEPEGFVIRTREIKY